ncbi:hypothetical protein I4U23_003519 [Adineta vaga]|nr:hypothetical protein I4U23_003519 [Adineta vaga]
MNKIIISILVIMIGLVCFTESINESTCTCTCCAGNSCTPKHQGSFTLNACSILKCMHECSFKYNQCPLLGGAGHLGADCKIRQS